MKENGQSPKEEGFAVLEQIHTVGFPTDETIDQIVKLVYRLEELSPHFHPADQLACKQMAEIVQRICDCLDHDGDVPVKLYTELNRKYIVLKSGLHHHM